MRDEGGKDGSWRLKSILGQISPLGSNLIKVSTKEGFKKISPTHCCY